VFGLRGAGSNAADFEQKRFRASGDFAYVHGELSHERDLPGRLQVFGRVHGQLASQPLVNTEQVSGGGLSTVRGYLESEVLGDNAIFATAELRSPSLFAWLKKNKENEWRFYAFADGGYVTLREPLPEQVRHYALAESRSSARGHQTRRWGPERRSGGEAPQLCGR
jgi:hemolysin activation/secretion protein